MSYEDLLLTCRDCGKEFVFTAGEQEFYSQKGFLHNPVRCPACRRARRQPRPDKSDRKDNRSEHQRDKSVAGIPAVGTKRPQQKT